MTVELLDIFLSMPSLEFDRPVTYFLYCKPGELVCNNILCVLPKHTEVKKVTLHRNEIRNIRNPTPTPIV